MSDIGSDILAGGSDGMIRKVPDVSKIQGFGWKAKTSLKGAITLTYKHSANSNLYDK